VDRFNLGSIEVPILIELDFINESGWRNQLSIQIEPYRSVLTGYVSPYIKEGNNKAYSISDYTMEIQLEGGIRIPPGGGIGSYTGTIYISVLGIETEVSAGPGPVIQLNAIPKKPLNSAPVMNVLTSNNQTLLPNK